MSIEVIYKMLINNMELNDNNLTKCGFTKEDINKLIKDKKLKQVQDKYELVDLEAFFKYGILLSINGNNKLAYTCFRKCYELCPKNNKFCYQLLTMELKKQNRKENSSYDEAFDIFINIEKNAKKEISINNSRLYLYLFSFIHDSMPEEYKKKVSNIKWYDLMLERKPNTKDENQIRRAIVQRRFKYALELLDKLIKKQNNHSISFELLRALLNEVIDAENKKREALLNLIKEEKYKEIVSILETRSNLMGLIMTDENILLVLKALIKMNETNEIPFVKEGSTNISEAVSNNDFELAYKLDVAFLSEHRTNKEDNIFYIALLKINNKICDLRNQKNSDMEELAYFIKESGLSLKEAIKKYSLTTKSLLLIKLIYVRDYYIEGMYLEGDTLLKEVELYKGSYLEIDKYIDELKINRDNYKDRLDIYIKSRKK